MRTGLSLSLTGVLCVGVLLTAAPADSPVADAARRGDADGVRALLQQGDDANAAHGDGMSALHWAAERGDARIAEMLLYAGANAEAVTRIGQYTPLHLASRGGRAAVAKLLLDAGATVAVTSNGGTTSLHLAAASGSVDVVEALVDHGADVDARETVWEQTPLMFAAAQNRVEAIRALLDHGADADLTSQVLDLVMQGKLAQAASKRQRKVLDAFEAERPEALTPSQVQAAIRAARDVLRSGEIPEPEEEEDQGRPSRPPTIEHMGGLTALLHAARQGHSEAAMALLDGGADVNQVSAGDGTSALLMATINGQFDLAMQIIDRGADPNLASTLNGAAPLWAAVNTQWQPRTRFPQPQEHGLQQATYLDLAEALLRAAPTRTLA